MGTIGIGIGSSTLSLVPIPVAVVSVTIIIIHDSMTVLEVSEPESYILVIILKIESTLAMLAVLHPLTSATFHRQRKYIRHILLRFPFW